MVDKSVRELIIKQLEDIALEDGTLSNDEQELIYSVLTDIERYSDTLQQALSDGFIDEMEERQLFEGRMRVMEKAYAKAREDRTITDDEKQLLKAICRIVLELEDY